MNFALRLLNDTLQSRQVVPLYIRTTAIEMDRSREGQLISYNVDRHHLPFSAAKLARELGHRQRFSDQEGVNRAVEWEKVNPPPANPEQAAEADPMNYAAQDEVLRKQGYTV
jgi:hypothetical protein